MKTDARRTGKTKGAVLLARRSFVEERFGAEAWDTVLKHLPEPIRQDLETGILASNWYPFEYNDLINKIIVDVLAKGDRQVFEEMGRWSARKNLKGPHRMLLCPGNPQRMLTNSPHIHKIYYDTGYRTYESTGPNSCLITTYDAEIYSEIDCLTNIGWHKEALEMCGAKNVRMREVICRAHGSRYCQYEIAWEM